MALKQVSLPVKPRPPSATSIPSMIQIFQNEWDALMLETHTLKQHNHTLRQELAHALYQHDAGCRVIARLIKERDDARAALASGAGAPAGDAREMVILPHVFFCLLYSICMYVGWRFTLLLVS